MDGLNGFFSQMGHQSIPLVFFCHSTTKNVYVYLSPQLGRAIDLISTHVFISLVAFLNGERCAILLFIWTPKVHKEGKNVARMREEVPLFSC